MKSILLILLMLAVSACIPEETAEKNDSLKIACFDIVQVKGVAPNSPLLIDKCTGETWMILRSNAPLQKGQKKPDFYYGWYRVERYAAENSVVAY